MARTVLNLVSRTATRATPILLLVLFAMGAGGCGSGGDAIEPASDAGGGLPSADATLSSLALPFGIAPDFDPAITTYALDVALLVSDVSIAATATRGGARITVNGVPLESGTASDAIELALGPNPVALVVTAEDGSTRQTYTVVITRAPAVAPEAFLKASNASAIDNFGHVVAIDGDTLVVGAYGESSGVPDDPSDNTASSAGAVYVFTRSGTTWSQQAYLKAAVPGSNDWFGRTVSIRGDTLLVGAPLEDSSATGGVSDDSARSAGAAFVFTRTGTTWTQQAFLKASNAQASDQFGHAVAVVDDDRILVGAPYTNNGTVYAFVRTGTTWSEQQMLEASNPNLLDEFGRRLAVSGETVAVGAPSESSSATGGELDNSMSGAGAVYVFTHSGTAWSQQAYVKASNAGVRDNFGFSIALSGDTLAVGAIFEGSSASGGEMDDSAARAGAAYVFTRTGTTWSQETFLKASNAEAEDRFGVAIALAGDTVVVGAGNESSSAMGGQADNSATFAGAAYLFVRAGSTWSQAQFVKASNADAEDAFGFTLAASIDTLVVGSFLEDSSVTGGEADNSASRAGAAYVLR